MSLDLGKIRAAPPESCVAADLPPTFSPVIRSIDAALLWVGVNRRVKDVWIAARNVETDAPKALLKRRQSRGQLSPGIAAVGRFEEAAFRPLPRAVLPRPLPSRPQVGVNDLRIRRVERDLDRAGVFVLIQHATPRRAPVNRPIDAALSVGP